jgi:acyl transferase domain-containing protein/NAD(P)-dependent dehydrogenase (short-subunit alcohol dehydrogenase family)
MNENVSQDTAVSRPQATAIAHADSTQATPEPLAIIGIGCRFPGGADTPERFWELLVSGADGVREIPEERWDTKRFYDPDPGFPGKMFVRHGGYLREPVDEFDPLFFGISPREAGSMDPQQRLMLEVSWEAFEDAGLQAERLAGSDTGVFVGGFMLDNKIAQLSPLNRPIINNHTGTSSTLTMLANRVSYVFDLRGPSVSLDTACSSSLTAFHQACQAIWSGECEMAVSGGASVIMRPEYNIGLCKGQFLAADGRSKSFDADADGYGRGEGAGAVIVKPYAQALRDGDKIYALVCATGANQDGRTDGITVPSGEAQRELIRKVLRRANVRPEQVAYVEAHGTGTAVGDPTECGAIGAELGGSRRQEPLVIGSVKANLGHLEAAAGVAGVIKAALTAKHGVVPPQISVRTPNPTIPFDELGLRLPLEPLPLSSPSGGGYVAVNSFGYGGANAHALLRRPPTLEATTRPQQASASTPWVLPLSARSEEALPDLAGAFAELLRTEPAPDLADLCHSAAFRRSHHSHRLAIIGKDHADLTEQLEAYQELGQLSPVVQGRARPDDPGPVFVYTGMGPQWWGMGRELMQESPVFREEVLACDQLFHELAGWSVLEALGQDEENSRVAETQVAQPANFLIQAGLTALWRSWGIRPAAIVGHSVGEVGAAYGSGMLTREEAVKVSYFRSRAQQTVAGKGKMLAVGLTQEEAEARVVPYADQVSLAAVNSPQAITLAGDPEPLEEIARALEAEGVFNRFLRVEVAYHSPQMEPLKPRLLQDLADLHPRQPEFPLYSSVTGQRSDRLWDAHYWADNIRQPVLFGVALETLLDVGYRTFLEVGPHPVLGGAIQQNAQTAGVRDITVTASLNRKQAEMPTLLDAAANLYVNGQIPDWNGILPEAGRFIAVPRHPWRRERYWHETDEALADRLSQQGPYFPGRRIRDPRPVWEMALNRQYLSYLKDHCVDGAAVFPAAGYIAAALALHREIAGDGPATLEGLRFERALLIDARDEPQLRTTFDESSRRLAIYSRPYLTPVWQRHAVGRLSLADWPRPAAPDLATWCDRCPDAVDVDELYEDLKRRGLEYTGPFRGLTALWAGADAALCRIRTPEDGELGHPVHPALLDCAFQSLIALLEDGGIYLPVGIDRLHLLEAPSETEVWCCGVLTEKTPDHISGDLHLFDSDGRVLASILGLRCQALARRQEGLAELDGWRYAAGWIQQTPETPVQGLVQEPWLVLTDSQGLGDELAEALSGLTDGAEVIRARSGTECALEDPKNLTLRPDHGEDFKQLLQRFPGPFHIAFLWGIDTNPEQDPLGERNTLGLMHLLQALSGSQSLGGKRLLMVTRGAQSLFEGEVPGLEQTPLLGLARVAASELGLSLTLSDLDPNKAEVAPLLADLADDPVETETAWRDGERWLYRQQRAPRPEPEGVTPLEVSGAYPCELAIDGSGTLDGLHWQEVDLPPLGEHEIEIRVKASALSFKDVLKALGKLPPAAVEGTHHGMEMGMEVSGVIEHAGAKSLQARPDLAPGVEVVASVRRAFAGFVRVATNQSPVIALKPHALSHVDAASVPVVFTTAYYALCECARLRAGQRILIHSATGGVGLAAVTLAQWIGAEIFATAGSDEKRNYLRGFGLKHVFDSRSLEFVDGVRQATDGAGVDVVIHALSGEIAQQSLELLGHQGHCIDLGKRDMVNDGDLPLAAFRRAITYHAVDLDIIREREPQHFLNLYEKVSELIAQGALNLPPVRSYPPGQVREAFEEMAKARHIGKIVLEMDSHEPYPVLPAKHRNALIRPDRSYLITGGFGGFGLAIAHWLAGQGCRQLVLAGRRGAASEPAQRAVAELEAKGVMVHAKALDVSDPQQVQTLLNWVNDSLPTLDGVFHAAAVLDDCTLGELTPARLRKVLAPKAGGAWNLHHSLQILKMHPQHFILFSSVAVPIGNAGQGSYVAANSFLDGLAHYRRAAGLAATSIQWGALSEVGMAADNPELKEHFERLGIRMLSPAMALLALEQVMRENPVGIGIFDLDWQRFARNDPRFSELLEQDADQDDPAQEMRRRLAATDPGERIALIEEELIGLAARILRLPPERLDPSASMNELGLDSIVTVELQIALEPRFGIGISTLELMRAANMGQLAREIAARMGI